MPVAFSRFRMRICCQMCRLVKIYPVPDKLKLLLTTARLAGYPGGGGGGGVSSVPSDLSLTRLPPSSSSGSGQVKDPTTTFSGGQQSPAMPGKLGAAY
jgi:hypothetical protein